MKLMSGNSTSRAKLPRSSSRPGVIQALPGLAGTTLEAKRIADQADTTLLTTELKAGNRVLGWIAQIHPARARQLDARHAVYVAELSLATLRQASSNRYNAAFTWRHILAQYETLLLRFVRTKD